MRSLREVLRLRHRHETAPQAQTPQKRRRQGLLHRGLPLPQRPGHSRTTRGMPSNSRFVISMALFISVSLWQ